MLAGVETGETANPVIAAMAPWSIDVFLGFRAYTPIGYARNSKIKKLVEKLVKIILRSKVLMTIGVNGF